MGTNHENHDKCPLYNYDYTLSGVAYIFLTNFIPYRDKIRYKKQFFTTLSDVNFSLFSFFCA